MPKYRQTGSISGRVKVLDFLRTVCHKDADGYSVYDEGWSDKKVSRHLRVGVSTAIVGDIRREYIGKSRDAYERWLKSGGLTPKVAARPAPTEAATPTNIQAIVTDARLIQIEAKLDRLLRGFGLDPNQTKD